MWNETESVCLCIWSIALFGMLLLLLCNSLEQIRSEMVENIPRCSHHYTLCDIYFYIYSKAHRRIDSFCVLNRIFTICVCVCDCIRVSCRIQNRSIRPRSWTKRDIRTDHRRSIVRVAYFTQFFENYLTLLRCKTAQSPSPIWFEKKYASQSPDWSGKLWIFTLWITFQFMRKLYEINVETCSGTDCPCIRAVCPRIFCLIITHIDAHKPTSYIFLWK